MSATGNGRRPADLCIITVTHNSARHLATFLAALPAAADGVRLRVVVVDNDSQDGSAAVARDAGVVVVETGANLGYSAGINAGRRHAAGCAAIAIANPDLRFEPHSLSILYTAVLRSGGIAVPTLLGPDGALCPSMFREPTVGRQLGEALFGDRWPGRPHWLSEIVRDRDAYRCRRPVEWATGAAFVLSATCDAAVGAWDESYFLFSEEVDFAWRARRAGFPIHFVPEARAVHEGRGSGRGSGHASLLPLVGMNKLRYYRTRHSRAASAGYAVGVLLQMLVRARDAEHRHAARVLATAMWPAVARGEFADLVPAGARVPRRR
jgi:N-acetylglucosaminyl-diphospho-decaprenol L-rhamnosyltransferase